MQCLSSYLCNKTLLDNITDNCKNPMYSGIDSQAIIFNFSDLVKSKIKYNADNSHIVTDLGITSANYIINARQNPFTGTNTTVEIGDYRNTFTRTVSLFVPQDGAAVAKSILDPLANGKFVVILKNNYVNTVGDNEYQIYGLDNGLAVSSMTQTKYENNDYWIVELQETGVNTSGMFLMYDGMRHVLNIDVNFEYVDLDPEGAYSASFTINQRTYTLGELTGNAYFDDLTTQNDSPADNASWIPGPDSSFINVEYTYPDPITIEGREYTLIIPAGTITFGQNTNGDFMWTKQTTEEYLCGLLDLQ